MILGHSKALNLNLGSPYVGSPTAFCALGLEQVARMEVRHELGVEPVNKYCAPSA